MLYYLVVGALKAEKRAAAHIGQNSLFVCGLVSLTVVYTL
jgi:hypothetical protein